MRQAPDDRVDDARERLRHAPTPAEEWPQTSMKALTHELIAASLLWE